MTQTVVGIGQAQEVEPVAAKRATVPDLPTSRPIAEQLPALFQEDDFCVRLTQALDEVLAPVYLVLDSLEAYIDPDLAPEDFLEWLAGWVGLHPEDLRDDTDNRALVAHATSLFSLRGTPAGLTRLLELASGRPVVVEDSGGVRWSPTAESELPGSPQPSLTVRVGGSPITPAEERTLRRMLQEATPAHVPATLVLEPEGGTSPGASTVDGAVEGHTFEDGAVEDGAVEDGRAVDDAVDGGAADHEPRALAPDTGAAAVDHEGSADLRNDQPETGDEGAGRDLGDGEDRPER